MIVALVLLFYLYCLNLDYEKSIIKLVNEKSWFSFKETILPPTLVEHVSKRRFLRDSYLVPPPKLPDKLIASSSSVSSQNLAVFKYSFFPKLDLELLDIPRPLSVENMKVFCVLFVFNQ